MLFDHSTTSLRHRLGAAGSLALLGLLAACSGAPGSEEPAVISDDSAATASADANADARTDDAREDGATPSAHVQADGTILVDGDSASFLMPSQNVACLVRPDQVVCQIDGKEYDAKKQDINPDAFQGCTPAEADAMTVGGGADPTWSCLPYDLRPDTSVTASGRWAGPGLGATTTYQEETVAVLPYGRTLRLGNISCTSDRLGVDCTDLVSGHGFQLAMGTYTTH